MSTSSPDPLGLTGQTLEGKYAIDHYVAKGGFGVVYRAQHLRLRKPVAMKLLRLDQKVAAAEWTAICKEFEAEAQNVAQLEHPAIVRVMDFGVAPILGEEAVPWMATEWMDGDTLSADLKSRRGRGGRSPRECLSLLKPVLEALAYAHVIRIVHRDIKPANLMFTGAASTGASSTGAMNMGRTLSRAGVLLLKVLDFGIAKVMEPDERAPTGDTATTTQRISFSMKYGAPEQFSGGRTGPWTDIHAIALVLSELLTDRPPYEGRDAMDFHLAAMSPKRPTPGNVGVDVGAWEPVLTKALALRPADRFESMADFLHALEAVVPDGVRAPTVPPAPSVAATDNAPVNTGTLPPVTSQTMRSATERRTRLAAVGGGVLLAAIGIAVAATTGRAPDSPRVGSAPPMVRTAVAPPAAAPAMAAFVEPSSAPSGAATQPPAIAGVTDVASPVAAADAGTSHRSRRQRRGNGATETSTTRRRPIPPL